MHTEWSETSEHWNRLFIHLQEILSCLDICISSGKSSTNRNILKKSMTVRKTQKRRERLWSGLKCRKTWLGETNTNCSITTIEKRHVKRKWNRKHRHGFESPMNRGWDTSTRCLDMIQGWPTEITMDTWDNPPNSSVSLGWSIQFSWKSTERTVRMARMHFVFRGKVEERTENVEEEEGRKDRRTRQQPQQLKIRTERSDFSLSLYHLCSQKEVNLNFFENK